MLEIQNEARRFQHASLDEERDASQILALWRAAQTPGIPYSTGLEIIRSLIATNGEYETPSATRLKLGLQAYELATVEGAVPKLSSPDDDLNHHYKEYHLNNAVVLSASREWNEEQIFWGLEDAEQPPPFRLNIVVQNFGNSKELKQAANRGILRNPVRAISINIDPTDGRFGGISVPLTYEKLGLYFIVPNTKDKASEENTLNLTRVSLGELSTHPAFAPREAAPQAA